MNDACARRVKSEAMVVSAMSSAPQRMRPVAERITGATTLGRMVLSAEERGEDLALRFPTVQGEKAMTYAELGERSRELALGLIALGIEAGDVGRSTDGWCV